MNNFFAAFWAEALKARRSKVSLGTIAAFLLLPLFGGLFMIILRDPVKAQSMGLISVKAQLIGGTADWPTFFDIMLQGMAIAGTILFAFITAWVFGREFSDHTAKELLAIPTPRGTIVGAKFVLTALWTLGLTLFSFAIGLGVATAVHIPGWSVAITWNAFVTLSLIALLHFMLMPLVALIASAGRGYLPPLGWALITLAFAQIAAVLGWGDWFPWTIPALVSGLAGPRTEQVGMHSYVLVLLVFIIGTTVTFLWWQRADQAK